MAEEMKVSFGVRQDGLVVHITELDSSVERGLRCNCTCSGCGDRLVARMGEVRQRHFAHQSVHNCVQGDESALHRFAKEVFQRHQEFRVPEAEVWWDREIKLISRAVDVPYVRALLEQPIGDIVPDITLSRENRPDLLVEILVTHEVDEAKRAKLEALGLPCIEIDLSALYCGLEEFDRNAIEQLIVDGDGYEKKWVCIPNAAKYLQELKEEACVRRETERRQAEQRLRRQREKAEWLQRTAQRRRQKQTQLISPAYIAALDERKLAELPGHPMWKRNRRILGITEDSNIPHYLNQPLQGEYLFKCHPVIWQSTLFIAWVFNKADMRRSRDIPVEYVLSNLKKQHGDLLELELYWAHKDRADVMEPAEVVGEYFHFLATCGFVRPSTVTGCIDNPFSWDFECLMPRVVALPPEFNSPRYRPREVDILDTETGEVIVP